MTSRQKRISWIVAGVLVQGLVIFCTIYYMEFRYAGEMSEARDVLSKRIPPSDYPGPMTPLTESAAPGKLPPQVRELIKIERGSATEIAKTIRELFGDRIKVSAVESSSSVVVIADQETLKEILQFIDQVSERSQSQEGSFPPHDLSRSEPIAEKVEEISPSRRQDIPDRTVLPDSNPEVSDPFASPPESTPSGNMLKFIPIQGGDAEGIAKTVKEVFGASVKATVETSSQSVIVVADPETQERVRDFIAEILERTSERQKIEELKFLRQAAEAERLQQEDRKRIAAQKRRRPSVEAIAGEHSDRKNELEVPEIVGERSSSPPLTEGRSGGTMEDPFGPPSPQKENVSPTAKFPADGQDAELDRLAKRLALRIREAKPGDQANLRKELETITYRQFQHRQQRRQQEFESLSQRLEQLKANHQRRQKHQAEVVERRIKDLLDPNADLRWEERELSDERPSEVANSGSPGGSEIAISREPDTTHVVPKGDPNKSNSNEPESTYNGVALSEWLRLLQTERNEEKVAEAVLAMNCLVDRADPRIVTRIIFRTVRNLKSDATRQAIMAYREQPFVSFAQPIVSGLMQLLVRLPADVVVEEVLSELKQLEGKVSTREFLGWFLYLFEANNLGNNYFYKNQMIPLDYEVYKESRKHLQTEIRRHSKELISRLVTLANEDEKLTNWAVRCAEKIVRISDQLITSYPGLVPLVDRTFEDPPTRLGKAQSSSLFYQGPVAAVMLGESGLRIQEILTYATEQLNQGFSLIPPGGRQLDVETYQLYGQNLQGPLYHERPTNFEDGLRCVVAIAAHSPEAVSLLHTILDRHLKTLDEFYAALEIELNSPEGSNLVATDPSKLSQPVEEIARITEALGQIGTPAIPSIPRLKRIAESTEFRGRRPSTWPQIQETGPDGKIVYRVPSLVDIANAAILKIEKAKPKPKPEPLPDDDFETQENLTASRITSPNGQSEKLDQTPPSRPIDETTYDGITYSQWLKLLETERKLDKVMAAIDTCTRLAVKGDERRIAKGVFVAEALLESDAALKRQAWDTGQAGLARLPTDIVIEELLLALRNPTSYKAGREFQYQLLIEFEHICGQDREAQIEILRSRSTEIVQEVVKSIPAEPDANSLPAIAAASQVCNLANRSINDFDGLTDRMIKVVTEVPADEKKIRVELWMIVAGTLTQQAPDTPDLATVLVKQTEKHVPASYPIVELIGRLGARAEPAVPTIVQLFIVEFNKIVTTSNPRLMPPQFAQSALEVEDSRRNSENAPRFCFQVIRTIGEIGQGQMGYDLVSELKQFDFPIDTGVPFHMRARVDEPMKALIDEAETAYSKFQGFKHSGNQLLSDLWVINGRWAEKFPLTSTSDTNVSDVNFAIRGTVLISEGPRRKESTLSPLLLKLDPNASVQISIVEDTSSRKKLRFTALNASRGGGRGTPKSVEGLYQFSDSILKLQLAPPGQPAPEEFCTDKDSLPEGQVLIELQRIAPVPANADEIEKN